MPDGDIVHGKLPGLYQKPYKWICEGKASNNECVGALMRALMRDLKKKDAAPVVLAKRIGEQLKLSIHNGSQSWGVLSQQLDQIARQAECPPLAASKIEDKTRYVVPHGSPPASDPNLHLSHMLAQVKTLRNLLTRSSKIDLQWEALTGEFPELDDIVDRSAGVENLSPAEMRSRLIELYQAYITEWDIAESQIATGILNKSSNQQTSDRRLTEATHALWVKQ